MIKEVNQSCEKLNGLLGISVTLPNPKGKALKAAAMCNFVIGAGLMAAGIAFSSKFCVMLGGIGLAGSAVLHRESKSRAQES